MFCSNSEVKTWKSDKRRTEPNGCGPNKPLNDILNLVAPDSVLNCCNAHDFCYANCTQTFYDCETQFDSCLTEAAREIFKIECADKDIKCNLSKLAKMLTTSFQEFTEIFGCHVYKKPQQRFCTCEPKK